MENELVVKKPEPQEDSWADEPKVVEHTGKPERDGAVVTVKAGAGYDAPWIVLHATSMADATEQLNSDEFTELMDLTARKGKEFAKAFGGSQSFSKPSGGGGWGNKTSAASSSPAGAVEWDAEAEEYTCVHGGAVQRKGESDKGPWTGYFCPQPKGSGDNCSPKFLNKKR